MPDPYVVTIDREATLRQNCLMLAIVAFSALGSTGVMLALTLPTLLRAA